jgi:hypothetical protein
MATLEQELKRLSKKSKKQNYWQNYIACKEKLIKTILPSVTTTADAIDGSMLTDHGPEHIETVIEKASLLVNGAEIKLVTYEIYLLLLSILVHDLGNALGRDGHETKIQEVWKTVWGPLGFDQFDMVIMLQIAGAHGGTVNQSKDTIRALSRETKWMNESVRPQLLASILRLADEMSEDRHRANLLAIELDKVKEQAQAYHYFAAALHSFGYDSKACELQIGLAAEASHFRRNLGKRQGVTTLLDEIYERVVKVYQEAVYCSKYALGYITVHRVRVNVKIFKNAKSIMDFSFVAEETGHPGEGNFKNIFSLCPELNDFQGKNRKLDHTLLEELVAEKERAGA